MSRTFKRPMFRKGGNVGVGIMSGITDRVKAQDGFPNPFKTRQDMEFAGMRSQNPELLEAITASKASLPEIRKFPPLDVDTIVGDPKGIDYFIEQLREGAGEYGGLDPATSFLLTVGPRIARAKSFSDLISKLDEPAQQLIKQADAKAKFERDLRLGGTQLGLDEEKRFAERRSDLEYEKDKRNYLNLQEEDRRIYDEAVRERARNYNRISTLEQQQLDKEAEKRGELFELEKIKLEAAEQMKAIEAQIAGQKEITRVKEDAKPDPNRALVAEKFYDDTNNLVIANNMADIVTVKDKAGLTELSKAKALLGNKLAEYTQSITLDLDVPSNLKTWATANKDNIKQGVTFYIDGTDNTIKEIRLPKNDAEKVKAKKSEGLIIKEYSFDEVAQMTELNKDDDLDGNVDVTKKIIDFGDTKLTREEASVEAGKRGYVIIPPRPEGLEGRQKGNYVKNEKAKARERGENAITLTELETILRAEKTKKRK